MRAKIPEKRACIENKSSTDKFKIKHPRGKRTLTHDIGNSVSRNSTIDNKI